MFRHGAHGVGYGSIVGIGTNAAILHFEPGARTAKPNDLVLLLAMGAQTVMVRGDKKIPYNEREVVQQILQSM